MNEQTSLFEELAPEQLFFEYIKNGFAKIVKQNNSPPDSAVFSKNKDYYSFSYRNNVVFLIRIGPRSKWVKIPAKYIRILQENQVAFSVNKQEECVISISGPEAALDLAPLLYQILDYAIDTYPKEYSCCSRYVECSDAKACVNPHLDIAMNCRYRVNLKKGKIFYGKNAVV